ncbi:hypothetical protein V8E36_002360 [Tilletia maclaganii]
MLSDEEISLEQDADLDFDAEVLSGGACTPPQALRSSSPADSLFDSPRQLLKQIYHSSESSATGSSFPSSPHAPSSADTATRSVPPIPGLYLWHDVLSEAQASMTIQSILASYDLSSARSHTGGPIPRNNQVMLFGRARSTVTHDEDPAEPRPSKRRRTEDSEPNGHATRETSSTGLPLWVDDLLTLLSLELRPRLDPVTYDMLFPASQPPTNAEGCQSRQVIINNYAPGEGISPHVDLLQRFGDGILICSFISGTVMDFRPATADPPVPAAPGADVKHSVFLPPRSVALLHGPARYEWSHGIEGRLVDRVEAESGDPGQVDFVSRGQRISVTIRWLRPGADVVGG